MKKYGVEYRTLFDRETRTMRNVYSPIIYKKNNTKVYMVSPETTLGRKMTDEEKQKVLDEISRVKSNMYMRILRDKDNE